MAWRVRVKVGCDRRKGRVGSVGSVGRGGMPARPCSARLLALDVEKMQSIRGVLAIMRGEGKVGAGT